MNVYKNKTMTGKIKHKFIKYLSIIGALFFVMLFIWVRFLRERLPKDIPFNLSIMIALCIIFICIIYIIIIIKIKYKNNTSKIVLNQSILKIIQYVGNLLDNMDTIIKKNKIVTNLLFTIFTKIIIILELYHTKPNKTLNIILNVIPKFILLLFFIFDIFYFKKLEIFYYVLLLGLIPLTYSYCVYSIKKLLETFLHDLEQNYYIKILSTTDDESTKNFMVFITDLKYNDYGVLNLRYFVEIQSDNLIFDYDLYKYTCIETGEAREEYAKKHNITLPKLRVFEPNYDYISKELSKNFFEKIEHVVNLQAFIEGHKTITIPNITKNYTFYLLISYLICWLYILIVSIHTLNLQDVLKILESMQDLYNPFSGLPI